jgi:hypothetical protein
MIASHRGTGASARNSALGALLALSFLAFPAAASGTLAPRAGDAYGRGKSVYLRQIACAQCAIPGGVSSTADAQALIARLERGELELGNRDRRSVITYLQRRWRIR